MKKLLVLCSFLLTSVLSLAQLTTVTATITDPASQAYVAGTVNAEYQRPFSFQGTTPAINGVPITARVIGNLDNTGTFILSLADLSQVIPRGGKWRFTISSNATASSYSIDIDSTLIFGGAVNLSAVLSAAAPITVVNAQPVLARAYRDSEILGGEGSVWIDVTNNTVKFLDALGVIHTLGSGGGGGIPGGADQQIQFNQTGAFQGSNTFTINYTNATFPTVTLKGDIDPSSENNIRYVTSDYNWSQNPTLPAAIAVGSNTVTVNPCPKGIFNLGLGSNYHNLYLSGTGTPEVVKITSTTCTTGFGPSGTITFTAANTHSAGYSLASATQGFQEASNAAMYAPTSPTGNIQSGKVILPTGEVTWQATATVMGSNQTADFSGSIVGCNMSTPCLFVGDPANVNNVVDVTIQNFRGRAMINNGTAPMIEDNGNKTRIINVATRQAAAGNSFGSLVQVDNDQAALIDGIDSNLGTWARCDSTFCSTAIVAPGPASTNAAVLWVKHGNLSGNCTSNGILADNGNTLHVEDTVIQAFPQFGVHSGVLRGGFGVTLLDNVYEEIGSCFNPVGYHATNFPNGLGQVGLISYGKSIIHGGGGGALVGQAITYGSAGTGGATQFNYYIVGHSTLRGATYPFFVGYSTPTTGSNILLEWPALCQAGGCGTVTYDILRTTGVGNGNSAPVGTGLFAVSGAQGISGSCSNGVCTATDTRVTLLNYTVPSRYAVTIWSPIITFLAGNIVHSVITENQLGVNDGAQIFTEKLVNVNQSGYHTSYGSLAPVFLALQCDPGVGGVGASSPYWATCLSGDSSINGFPAVGALVLQAGVQIGSGTTNLKGRIILENGVATGNTDLITLFDNDLGEKVGASAGNRPLWDANDVAIGVDSSNTDVAVGLALRSSGSISNYIGAVGDGVSWLERLQSTIKTFKVPTKIQVANNQLVLGISNTITFNATGFGGSRIVTIGDPGGPANMAFRVGTFTTGDCLKADANANIVDSGSACGVGGGTGTFQVNGANTTIQNPINFISAAAYAGLTIAISNPSVGNIQPVLSGTLTTAGGGTGVGTFTTNGILYGNGTGNVLVTAAGPAGTNCLQEIAGAAPVFASCAGAAGIAGSGTANKLTKFTAGTSVGNSNLTDDGTSITLAGTNFDANALTGFFKVPVQAGATPTASGDIRYDSTTNRYEGGVNGANSFFLVGAYNQTQIVQPTADVVPLQAKCFGGGVADCFAIYGAGGVKNVWVSSDGSFNFSGNTMSLGTASSTSQAHLDVYGGNSNSLPGYVQLLNNAGSLKVFLSASATNGIAMMTSATPGADDPTKYLVSASSTNTLTNKTYDTAGAGNVFKINGTQLSAVTGTGNTAVLATSPTITTPSLVTPTIGGYYLPTTITGGDICPTINADILAGQALASSPKIELSGEITRQLACLTDPFAGVNSTNQAFDLYIGGHSILTSVPWITPQKSSIFGNNVGGSGTNSAGSAIQASAAFKTNFPAVQGGNGTATICFDPSLSAPNNTTVIAGTNVAGTCTVGGTATFTPTAPPSSLVDYALYICPSGATCTPANTAAVGLVKTVTDASHLTLYAQIRSPFTIPASTTGYQYVFIQPLITIGARFSGCTGPSTGCVAVHEAIERVFLDCSDGASDLHTGFFNNVGQEGVWLQKSQINNCRWTGLDIETTGTQDSGPYDTNVLGGTINTSTLPVKIWNPGYFRGLNGYTLNNPGSITTEMQYVNTNSGGSVALLNIHAEAATDGITCGDLTAWPWASGGMGCQNTLFAGESGNNDLTNLIHLVNATTPASNGLVIETSTKSSSSVYILDDIHSKSYTTPPPIFTIGAPVFADGIVVGQTVTVAGTTAAVPSNTCTTTTAALTGLATTHALSWAPNASPSAANYTSLNIYVYPTANTVNMQVCNPTGGSITPTALTLQVRVIQ